MKVFWGIIGALAVITAALLMRGRGEKPGSATDELAATAPGAIRTPSSAPVVPEAMTPPEPQAQPVPEPQPEAQPEEAPFDPLEDLIGGDSPAEQPIEQAAEQPAEQAAEQPAEQAAGQPAGASPVADDEGTLTPNAPAAIDGEGQSETEPDSDAQLDALVKELQDSAKASETPSEGNGAADVPGELAPTDGAGVDGEPAQGAAEPEELPAPKPDPTKPEVVPSTFETREDGSMLADERFVIRGKGTKESPYVVTWDMLVATSELYDPRRDKLKIPERVKMLDGKYVTVVGYVAFPIVAEGPNEMLAMLNSWDGCCIGVPPTPYDAVEVRLRENATAEQMLMGWGSVTGRFKVEPYLAANWLLGLYLMDDATLAAESL